MAKPRLGESVDAVMRGFIKESDEWCGVNVVEALLVLSTAGPAMKFRLMGSANPKTGSRVGVALHEGLCIREATEAEETELEQGIALGMVQITRYRARGGPITVLHQADGQRLAA